MNHYIQKVNDIRHRLELENQVMSDGLKDIEILLKSFDAENVRNSVDMLLFKINRIQNQKKALN
jgi:hypothetical protein